MSARKDRPGKPWTGARKDIPGHPWVEVWGASGGPFLHGADGHVVRKMSWREFFDLIERGELHKHSEAGDVLIYDSVVPA